MSTENSTESLKLRRGEVLRNARNQAGLSARKLADRINRQTAGADLTENAIYAYESGRVLLSRESAERIAHVLRLPLGSLMIGDPDFDPPLGHDPADAGGDTEGRSDAHVRDYDRPAGTDAPAADRRFRNDCADLVEPAQRVRDTADVLRRLLSEQRYVLKSPTTVVKVFELLAADVGRFEDLPAAAHVRLQPATRPYDRPLELADVVRAIRRTADRGYAYLEKQARAEGNCAPACRKLARKLGDQLRTLDDALGDVRRAAGSRRS